MSLSRPPPPLHIFVLLPQLKMAIAISAKPFLSIPHLNSQRTPFLSRTNLPSLPQHPFLQSQSLTVPPLNPNQPLHVSGFYLPRNYGFSCSAQNGEGGGGETKDPIEAAARGESTMPERFRYLTKEAPDKPVRWPWLIALAFGVYAWRTVLWELSNWKKGILAIASFIGYLLKLTLAIVYPFIGPPITSLIRCTETVLYTIRSLYSGIIAAAPVQELTVIILLTSTLLAIAEAAVPDSANSQPYLLTLAGIIGYAAVTDFIPELVFWLLLMGIFCFARFFNKKDLVSSTLPVAAALSAVGQTWLRVVVMISYIALAIFHHSKKLSEGGSDVETASTVRKLPAPLVAAALTIGIHVAAKWVRYRHLTWMIA